MFPSIPQENTHAVDPMVALSPDSEEPTIEVVIEEEQVVPDPEPQVPFDDNLSEHMEQGDLDAIAQELISLHDSDVQSRAEWEKSLSNGYKLLGFTYEELTQPFDGAFGAFHPVMAEAVLRFQADAMANIWPASGPAKAKIAGKETPDIEKQAKRVVDDHNYWMTQKMPEYREETKSMLFSLALNGSAFKKVWYDQSQGRPMCRFIEAQDFVMNYGTSDLRTCERATHVLYMTHSELRRRQRDGFYTDKVDIPVPAQLSPNTQSKLRSATDSIHGQSPNYLQDGQHQLLEMHVHWNLKGFEDKYEKNGELVASGISLPYVITVEKDSSKILSIRRNWEERDPLQRKIDHFTHYKFIPGLGPYGLGFVHLIGGLTRSATAILRSLVNSGEFANMQGGHFNKKAIRDYPGGPLAPGEWRGLDLVDGALAQNMLPINYKEPSATLLQLLVLMVDNARSLAGTADMKVSEIKQETPVGTTLAIIERSLKVISEIHASIHDVQKQEFALLTPLIKAATQDYEYQPEGDVPPSIKQRDYDGRIDVIPVSDPNSSSMAFKVAMAQTILQMASTAPDVYDRKYLHRRLLQLLGAEDYSKLVPVEEDLKPMDPISENIAILSGKPAKVFPQQDHMAHITVHQNAVKDPKVIEMVQMLPNAQAIMAAGSAHIAEHVGHWLRTETEKALGTPLPAEGESIPPEVEEHLAPAIAMASTRVLQFHQQQAQQEKIQQQQQDPVLQMQIAEVKIKEFQAQSQAKTESEKNQIEIMRIQSRERTEMARVSQQRSSATEGVDSKERIEGAKIGLDAAKSALESEVKEDASDSDNRDR